MQPFGWYRALIGNPQYRWITLLGSLLYLISPIDLSPDIIPFLGQIDDVILLTVLFSSLSQLIFPNLQASDPDSNNSSSTNDDPAVQTVDVNATPID